MSNKLLLLVLAAASAAHAGVAEETVDIGGPCVDAGYPPGFHREHKQAEEAGDWERVIELRKQSVRGMCGNDFRWLQLAEAFAAAGRDAEAIEILVALHADGTELKAAELEFQPGLQRLIEADAFRRTALGRELQALRDEAARRLGSFLARLAALPPSERPPEHHVAEGACPFECCTYREWEVREATVLFDEPFGDVAVATLTPGSKVQGVTGEVHVQPVPVAVIHDHPPLIRGEIIFLLDYLGEGYSRYWRRGEIAVEDLHGVAETCLRPSRSCWAEYLVPAAERTDSDWWILIETEDGVRGWTDRSGHFDNIDACG